MDYEQQVANIRASANADVIAAVIDSSQEPSQIGPRAHLNEQLWFRLSSNDDARREQITQHLITVNAQLEIYLRRYIELRRQGISALSDYDIGIAYRGMGPEQGLANALKLVANHIACVRAQIVWLEAEQQELVVPQMALF